MSIERAAVPLQIVQGTPATLGVTFYAAGEPADPGEVTVTLTDLDGDMVASGTAAAGATLGERTYALTADQTARLTTLAAVWESEALGRVTTWAEVVGDLLFTLHDARAFDGGKLSNAEAYPDSFILEARTRISEAFERICGVAFGRRYTRVVLSGAGDPALLLPDIRIAALRTVETRSGGTWTAYTADELADVVVEPYGVILRDTLGVFPRGTRNVRVGYEYGHERVPLEIKRAALVVLVDAIESNVSDRATSYSNEMGTFRISTAGMGRNSWFGLPQADAALARYIEKGPGIA